LHFAQDLASKYSAAIFGNKDQMCMHYKNTMATGS